MSMCLEEVAEVLGLSLADLDLFMTTLVCRHRFFGEVGEVNIPTFICKFLLQF